MKTLTTISVLVIIGALTGPLSYAQEREGTERSQGSQTSGTVGAASGSDTTRAEQGRGADGAYYDAWGARRSFGWAVGEIILVNNITWSFNEFLADADFSQVNPRTWWSNITEGFTWDDNHFVTNMFAHPYNGQLYYNSARSNGFSYWPSMAFAFLGSIMWECCGETHPMAINDWIMTSVGGTAIGETFYRLSSTILDNESTGTHRILREIGAALIDPVRGFNRLRTGRTGKVGPNPTERRPEYIFDRLRAGMRWIGVDEQGEQTVDSTDTHPFFEIDFTYGDPFESRRDQPFDFFRMGLQVNFSNTQQLGRLQVRGDVTAKDLKRSEKTSHVFTVYQNYDYINNNAVEFGGQSFSAAIDSRFNLSDTWAIQSEVDITALVLGAVNSEYAFVADVADEERLREYDFGPGLGGRIGATLMKGRRPLVTIGYRMQWIHTLNGSIVETPDGSGESDAEHIVQFIGATAVIPIHNSFGLGGDFFFYSRHSYFSYEAFANVVEQVPQFRVYGTWDVGH